MADQATQVAVVTPRSADGATGRLAMIAGLAGLTFLAVAGGGATGYLIAGAPGAPAPEPATEAATIAQPAPPTAPTKLVPLETVITNIASPPSTILRLEASLVVDSQAVSEPEVLAAQIATDTLTFLRSLELAQIEGSRGLLHLREDLKERAMLRSPAVSDYIIQALVAQ